MRESGTRQIRARLPIPIPSSIGPHRCCDELERLAKPGVLHAHGVDLRSVFRAARTAEGAEALAVGSARGHGLSPETVLRSSGVKMLRNQFTSCSVVVPPALISPDLIFSKKILSPRRPLALHHWHPQNMAWRSPFPFELMTSSSRRCALQFRTGILDKHLVHISSSLPPRLEALERAATLRFCSS